MTILPLIAWIALTGDGGATAQDDGDAPVTIPETVELTDLALSIPVPRLPDATWDTDGDELRRAALLATEGALRWSWTVTVLPRARYRLAEPEDVADYRVDVWREFDENAGISFDVREQRTIRAPLGEVDRGVFVHAARTRADRTSTTLLDDVYLLAGLTETHGVLVELHVGPGAGDAERARAAKIIEEGWTYTGPKAKTDWTEEQLKKLWETYAPPQAQEDWRDPIETEHYVVLTNSSGGKLFAQKMEQFYDKIRKTYPFEEVEGRRRMPVYLFRTNEQYYDFCEKMVRWSRGQARASKGHAWRDYYATWYESPNDPVHIHEATHQIFANRLRLTGGGSWFQEGVAEYIESSHNDRNVVASLVAKGKATPMRELMRMRSLLFSSKTDQRTGNQAHSNYKLAALWIEFLRESSLGKDRFMDFVHAVGGVSRGDLHAIEAAVHEVYGIGLDELEAKFDAYCKRR